MESSSMPLAGAHPGIGQADPCQASTAAKPNLGIRTRLLIEGQTRDLALFNPAIDSKPRGCDVVALRVEDVAPNGYAVDRATVRQKKTGRPFKFELTELTRQAVADYLRGSGKKPAHSCS